MAPRLEGAGLAKADRKPVMNADLWQALEAAAAQHTVTWTWTRGHNGDALNERADAIASEEARKAEKRANRSKVAALGFQTS